LAPANSSKIYQRFCGVLSNFLLTKSPTVTNNKVNLTVDGVRTSAVSEPVGKSQASVPALNISTR
ncbi:MAG: hypothetical protein ACREEM_56115, partial [Blastocatellia bacterium]